MDSKILLAGTTPGPWEAYRDELSGYFVDTALGTESTNGHVIADDILGEQAEANARLIAAAPQLAREHTALSERVVVLEGERDGYMAALRWVYENGLPHDSERPDFVNRAFSDAFAPVRAALKGCDALGGAK